MSEPARRKAVYEDLFHIPENTTGEIINGDLHVTLRPSRKHVYAATVLGDEIGSRYRAGRGGPGGWIVLIEPEIAFGKHIIVPDLAAWKKKRFPIEEPHNWISAAPEWVCEILSPNTAPIDRTQKMPVYAQHRVSHAWLIDPILRTLELFKQESGRWIFVGAYAEAARVRAEPFAEIELDLRALWLA